MPDRAMLVVGASLITAAMVDFFALPAHHVVSSLYAIPILIAATWMRPTAARVVAVLSLFLGLASAYIQATPLRIWPFGLFGLAAIGYLGIRLADQRQEAASRAREAEVAHDRLQEFLGMVAHDLRQPLVIVLGYAQLLTHRAEATRPESEQKALLSIEEAAGHMRRLVDDLLDAARIGAGRFEVRPAPMDLVAVLRQVLEQQQATTTKHRLILEAPERLAGSWDQERIGQVVTNLVSNAIKYSPSGGTVQVAVHRSDDEAVIRVADQGVGMTPAQTRQLFQPFARLEGTAKGAGLGLYITKGIVEAHGGRVSVESDVGKGSTFSVALPLESRRRSAKVPLE